MWSVTNYFLLNLTISDIMMATLNTPVSFIYMRDRLDFREGKFNKEAFKTQMFIRVWHFGAVYCTINQFISLSTVRKNPIEKRRFFTAILCTYF